MIKLSLKFIMMFLFALTFSGCFDAGVEKCDTTTMKETVLKILIDNRLKSIIETQARQFIDKEKVAILAENVLKRERYNLIVAQIQQIIERRNKKIIQKNEQIEADNRYSGIKTPIEVLIDGKPIMDDVKKYKAIIDNFEPINRSDSFEKYFSANVLSKSPLFALHVSSIFNSYDIASDMSSEASRLQGFIHVVFFGSDVEGADTLKRNAYNKIEKELLESEVKRIIKTVDIVNIKEIAIDEKSKKRQCEGNIKLGEIFLKPVNWNIKQLDDGKSRVDIK